MAQYFSIHPSNPQRRLVQQAVEIIRGGGVIVYPTDSCYALGCQIGDKQAETRIRAIRDVGAQHHFTLVCCNLAEVSQYAHVDNTRFRLLKANTPGAYTFILRATREVPRRLQHPKRSTIGVRIPDHDVVSALLEQLNEPILSMTLLLPGETELLNDAHEIRTRLEHRVDLVIDAGACPASLTTVIDLTADEPAVVRVGSGDLTPFGLAA